MVDPTRQPTKTTPPARIRLFQWLFRGLLFLWGTVVLGFASSVGATWFTTKEFDATGTPLGWVIQHLPVVFACSGVLLVLTIVSGVLGRQRESFDSYSVLSPPAQKNRHGLIQQLRNEYEGQRSESIQGAALMSLALQVRKDMSSEWFLPPPTSIVQAYEKANFGLLLLGAPGAGKSTLLRDLALELLAHAEQDTDQPVPVIMNLSSWAIKKPPLTVWVVDRLWETYRIPRRLSQALIAHNQLLLLLDGLDEVKPAARASCIREINTYWERQQQLVVCSRSQEYQELEPEKRLRLSVAVEIQPPTTQQIEEYLENAGPNLAKLRVARQTDPVLQELTATPLMLSVIARAYHDIPLVPDILTPGTLKDRRERVFATYVDQMIKRRRASDRASTQERRRSRRNASARYITPERSQKIRHWLFWLAWQMEHRQMEQQKPARLTDFYLEQLQPTWLATKQAQAFYYFLVRGLPYGLVGALVGCLGFWWSRGFGLITVLIGAMIGTLIGTRQKKEIRLVELWSWEGFGRGLAVGLASTLGIKPQEGSEIRLGEIVSGENFIHVVGSLLIYGLCFVLTSWLIGTLIGGGLGPWLIRLLLIFLFVALGHGLSRGAASMRTSEYEYRRRPNQGIQSSGQNGCLMAPLGALLFGLLFGLGIWLFDGLPLGLVGALFSALLGGLLTGLLIGSILGLIFFGGAAYLEHYLLRFLLWRSGAIPWHYIRFLEEAREHVLLHRVGGGYRFIHDHFQQYFASLEAEPLSSPKSYPPS
jgi:hypothetical protein